MGFQFPGKLMVSCLLWACCIPPCLALEPTLKKIGTLDLAWSGNITCDPRGRYVYMSSAYDEFSYPCYFMSVDVADPRAPKFLSKLMLGAPKSIITSIKIRGTLAYVVAFGIIDNTWLFPSYLFVIDITRPENPVLKAQLTLADEIEGGPRDICLSGSRAYVVFFNARSTLMTIDLANPLAPTVLRTSELGVAWGQELAMFGNYLLAVAQSNDFVVLDTSNTTIPPQVVSSVIVPNLAADAHIAVSGNRAYTGGLSIFDLTTISSPTLISRWKAEDPLVWGFYDIFIDGKYAYLSNQYGLYVVDVSNPAQPRTFSTDITGSGELVSSVAVMDGILLTTGDKFNVYQGNNFEVLSPQGGETFKGDSLIPVQWRATTSVAGTVAWFELWKGNTRIQLLDWDYSPTGSSTKKIYLPLQEPGSDYRIRAVSLWDWHYFDFSGYFTITGGAVKLQGPNGGQVWRSGSKEWVWWQTNTKVSGTAVRLELWRGGAKAATLATDWDPRGEAVKIVTVPALTPAKDYKLRVVSLWNPAMWDESDGKIEIAGTATPVTFNPLPALNLLAKAPEIPARRATSGTNSIDQIGLLALNGGRSLAAAGNCLVGSHGTAEKFIDLIDVSNPTRPTLLSSLKLTSATAINSIQVKGNRAFVLAESRLTGTGAIYTVDISRLDQPKLVHALDLQGMHPEYSGIYWDNLYDYLYVYGRYGDSQNEDILVAINIGDGHDPWIKIEVGQQFNMPDPRLMSVVGNLVYIIDNNNNAYIHRINRTGSEEFGSQPIGRPIQQLGTTGYGLSYSGLLSILNMTHPTSPNMIQTIPTGNSSEWSDLAVADGIICLGSTPEKAVTFIDYRNPAKPATLAQISYPMAVYRVLAYQGNFYTMHEDGLRVWHFNKVPLEITSPNGGENFMGDSIVPIQWRSDLSSAGTVAWFELWKGSQCIQFLDWDFSSTSFGTKKVYLPLQVPGSDYRIKAVSLWDWRYYDFSDSTFTITGGAVKVHSPNGGQTWRIGTREGIWWQTNPKVSGTAVRLELWKAGKKVTTLGTDWNPAGEAQKVVLVPVLPAGDYKLRAVSLFNPALWDESDGTIRISSASGR